MNGTAVVIGMLIALCLWLWIKNMQLKKGQNLRVVDSSWFDKTQPLWLPPGTVRALIVLGLTVVLMAILLKFSAFKEEIPSSVASIITQLLPALVLLIREYIGLRSKEAANGNGGG